MPHPHREDRHTPSPTPKIVILCEATNGSKVEEPAAAVALAFPSVTPL